MLSVPATASPYPDVSTTVVSLDRVADRLAMAVLLVVTLIAALTFRDYGFGWDDYTHSENADLLLALYGSGFRDTRAFSFVNLYMYGGGFDMAAALLAKILPFELFETRRLAGAIVGIIGLLVTWRIARRLGGPLAGLLALVLLAVCPLYYGHMFMNPKDPPFAVEMAFLLLGLVRLFEEYPRPSPATVVIVGIGFGLSVGTRILGGLAVLYTLAALALVVVAEMRARGLKESTGRLGHLLLTLLPGAVLAYIVMGFVWPWSILSPLNPLRTLTYFSHFFEKPWMELFAGSLIPVPDMPWTYLPTLLVLTVPEVLVVLGLAGLIGVLVSLTKRDIPVTRRAALLVVAMALMVPVAVAFVTRPAMYNGLRHFIFVVPPLAVLAGLAGAWLFDRLRRYGRVAGILAAAGFVAGITVPVVEMVRLHPYEYTHFNRLFGGVAQARSHYMLDYWGLSFKQASERLRGWLAARGETPPAGRRWQVAVCGPQRLVEVTLGPDFETTWRPQGADFAVALAEFYCAPLDAPVIAAIERDGVVYARVYDIRGRDIENLLTQPPP